MLQVWHATGPVAILAQERGELVLSYHAEWLARTDGFALSPRLPLTDVPTRGVEVLCYFANLLPEGPVLEALCTLRRLPRNNVYRLLEAFGQECAGAISVVANPQPAIRQPSYRPYSRAELAVDLARMRQNLPLLHSHGELRLSLAGAQNKIPVRYQDGHLYLPVDGAASTHILKPALQPAVLFPDAVCNEAFCLQLAQEIGIPTPKVEILREPEAVLLIARYDRLAAGEQIQRLHQVDFCQLSGVMPAMKYQADGGPGLNDCFALVDALSAAPAIDRLRLVDQLLFNFLIGNADAHAKNLAMLHTPQGVLRLAPSFDLLALGYWPTLSSKLAMSIGGEKRPDWIRARHWQRWCTAAHLNLAQLRQRALKLADAAQVRAPQTLVSLGAPAAFTTYVLGEISRRAKLLDLHLRATSV